ncbi:MAG: hypothetical protein V2A52_02910 [archaeon]
MGVFILALTINIVSASDVLVWQGQYYTGTTFNVGTYEFNFSVYDALTGGSVCYSNTTSLTTGNFGEWRTEQSGVSSACSNVSKDYYLNINIDGVDQTPRRRVAVWNFLRKDVDEVSTGNLVLHGVLQGLSPLKLQDEINFLKSDGIVTSALYNAPRELSSTLPSVFADSLIHDIIQETNDYGMQECFWDENTETMQMCISGSYLPYRATTVSRSFQVVGNTTNKPVNENFTLCEGNNYVDCDSDATGADLLVEDDIEAIGSIFSQENITANYFIGDGSLLTGISGGGNPFNQVCNTTSNVTFNTITGTGLITGVGLIAKSTSGTKNFTINYTGTEWDLSQSGTSGEIHFMTNAHNPQISAGRSDSGGSFFIDMHNGRPIKLSTISKGEVQVGANLTVGENINVTGSITTGGKIQGDYYANDSSEGITNLGGYSICLSVNGGGGCDTWCTLQIKNGLITGCS